MTRWVGRSVRRFEDARHLRGLACFLDDVPAGDALHVRFVRSPFAAARVLEVDATAALAVPGAVAVLRSEDLRLARPWSPRLERAGFRAVEVPVLAADAVRHAGEAVALVVATSQAAAEDTAESVHVAYEPLEAVASIGAALAPGAPQVHGAAPGNLLLDEVVVDDPSIEEALGRSALVVEAAFESARLTAAPMEGRGCLARWDEATGSLVLHTSTQVPHIVRTCLAELLGLSEHAVRVIAPDVGGGFGQKCVVAREEVALCAAARVLSRPLKWVEDRQESFLSGFQGHEQRFLLRGGFSADGALTALEAEVVADAGAYHCYPFTCGVEPLMGATELPGPYVVPRYRVRASGVATNKPPMAPYRGVSRPQMVLAIEGLLDRAARRLGLDAGEIRRANLVPDDGFPHRQPTGLEIDEGSYRASLARCEAMLDLPAFRARQAAARASGRLLGAGVALYAERSGYGTRAFGARRMAVTPGFDAATVRLDSTGAVLVAVGTAGHGQGHPTTLAQLVADELGVPPHLVRVVQGDTDTTPFGWGTFASRSLVVGGGAAVLAARRLAERVRAVAASMLDADPADVVLADGAATSGPSRVSFAEVGRRAYLEAHELPEGVEPGELAGRATYDPEGTFSNACHGAIVEVDPDTGRTRIERYVVVEDCGMIVNPAIVDGQVRGGVAQGIGAALYEELVYDGDGQLANGTFMDYLVPTAAEIPPIEIEHLTTPSARSITGAKGVGEGGMMGAPACIANAVSDAVAHLGIEIARIPISPAALARRIAEAELGAAVA